VVAARAWQCGPALGRTLYAGRALLRGTPADVSVGGIRHGGGGGAAATGTAGAGGGGSGSSSGGGGGGERDRHRDPLASPGLDADDLRALRDAVALFRGEGAEGELHAQLAQVARARGVLQLLPPQQPQLQLLALPAPAADEGSAPRGWRGAAAGQGRSIPSAAATLAGQQYK
jgi:hypothetical protein